jgi:cytoskeleton protein RodZ
LTDLAADRAADGDSDAQRGAGVGQTLARARQVQGLALSDVAQQLKFMPRHIEALEQERFESLPGPTIARGMVRSYAKLLKLDPEPLLERLTGRFEVPDADHLAARFSQPVPFSDSGRRSTVLYLALSACALAMAGGMAYQWRHEAEPQFIAAANLPDQAKAAAPRPAPAQTASAAAVSTMQSDTVEPAPVSSSASEPAPTPAPAPSKPASVAGSGEPKSIAGRRIVLRFDQEAWLEVTDGAGRLLASSLNAAGTERVVQGRPPFSLVIGNASHVKVVYNDRAVDLQPHVKVEVARFTLK